MNKTDRYSFIENLIKQKSIGRLETSQAEIEEEKELALASNDENSIEDEETKGSFVSPVLVAKMEKLRLKRETEEEILLSRSEKSFLYQELKKPFSSLVVKPKVEIEESFNIEGINISELTEEN